MKAFLLEACGGSIGDSTPAAATLDMDVRRFIPALPAWSTAICELDPVAVVPGDIHALPVPTSLNDSGSP
jgi:hypothetical protein